MRRMMIAVLTSLAALAMTASGVLADSPHFLYANASIDSGGALTVAFKDAGLGTGVSSVKVTLNADANAVYQCWNNGGQHPKAGNKQTVAGPLTNAGNFPVSHGQVTASISVGPLGPGTFACPSGQTLYLMSITYSNIVVSDDTGNSSGATPSTVSSGPIMIAV
jgi:hypothetical protein